MVDPIGIKTGAVNDRRIVSIAPAGQVASAKPVANEAPAVQTAATQVSRELAAKPPVDVERVARIKKAIQDGSFPIVSSTIADRLLALKLEWNPNDPA